MKTLQQRIKERRKQLNLTLADMSSQLGITDATLNRYESGSIKTIKYDMIVKIANILQCSPQYLMGWSDHITEPPQYDSNNENQEMISEFIRILKKLSPKDKIQLMSIIYDFEDKLNL